jgi:LruC domain-containing protein
MPSHIKIPIINGKAQLDISKIGEDTEKSADLSPHLKSAQENKYVYLGEYYTNTGLPKYLSSPDIIERSFLEDINTTLPEGIKVSSLNPNLIKNGVTTRLEITKKADVWVTFASESTDQLNALGYYKYKAGNAPKTQDDIKDWYVVFPNASMAGSGGGLKPGDKVYLGQFEANTVIEWFLVSQGFVVVVAPTFTTYYSQPHLYIENSSDLKSQMVMLWDAQREIAVMGFEDIKRDNPTCDHDFNDVLYYATTKPASAVKLTNMQELKPARDTDKDGIGDALDEYPLNADMAFNNYSPALNSYGTIAYEDLWPSKGDYDFNDLVVEYNYNLISNSQNKITTMEASFSIKHIGGSLSSAFAFTLPISAAQIEKITNQHLYGSFINTNANGTESDVNKAVIFVFDNARKAIGKELSLNIKFKTPINRAALGASPFNPFIVINEEREREIHLPDLPPTSKGNILLGQNDDNSDVAKGKYYRTKNNLPWALHFNTSFTAPSERTSIHEAYSEFIPWATSSGINHKKWYKK